MKIDIDADSGQRWNVAPRLLHRADDSSDAQRAAPSVIQLLHEK
jgi:hypothetical protein